MKKKVLVSMTLAVLLVAALAATAFASVSVSGPSSVEQGETIQVTISGTGEGVNGDISTSGLEYVSVSNQLSAPGAFVLLQDMGGMSVTYTYRVTASSGTVSVSLNNCFEAQGGEAVSISGDSWSASVAAEPTQEPTQRPTDTPSQSPTEQPSGEPSATVSATASGSAGATGSVKPGTPASAGNNNQDKMPKTGDATMDLWVLAVIAAGSVAAAVVAGKKVFAK